jgi:hypothetical protein
MGIDQFNEWGRTVGSLPSIDNDLGDELLVSSPGFDPGFGLLGIDHGRIDVWLSQDYTDDIHYGGEPVLSLPGYGACVGGSCITSFDPDDDSSFCVRCFHPTPVHSVIIGEQGGDRLGFAGSAGQFNQDGTHDVAAGAPGADREGFVDNGIFYVFFTPQGGFGDTDLATEPFPRLEIRGSHHGDQFGSVQTEIEDMNGDGISDVGFGSQFYDDDVIGIDAGYVGVILGNRPLTGENGFFPEAVGTPILAGVRFIGASAGAAAGFDVDSAGDFNADGFGDLLISSPNEVRCETTNGTFQLPVGGTCSPGTIPHFGVAYLIFGGTHLDPAINGRQNNVFNLTEVGQPQLPGIVFVGRILPGTGAETMAPLANVGGVGDIDGDGFDDIFVASPFADFVNLQDPTQRRVDAGEAYLIYGNNFGPNHPSTFP